MTPVKPRRRYDSARRAEQARQTRNAIIETARQLFLRDGFAGTTIAAIAAEARVSVETIYKAFGGKPGLVRAICTAALAGEGTVPAETRSDQLQLHEPDPRKIIRGWGELTVEVAPRISPIMLLVRPAAAADPEMAGLRA
jgi:AcrR family transcriptional regulator